jgi:hypothetical protein
VGNYDGNQHEMDDAGIEDGDNGRTTREMCEGELVEHI